ncbi:hypothetical protein ACIQNU_12310 [Streptomyces sp. NPDC091292]|uniref:hypothetical protein n=1 Tax=Streptomyces sp. NPDC091292 TaxID=3365991 RepID=UPI003812A825
MRPQRTTTPLPKRIPQRTLMRSEINLEHIPLARAHAAYTRLYTALVSHGVNLRSMSLREDAPMNPLIVLGGINIPTAERLIEALEKATDRAVEADVPGEGAS